MKMTIHVPIMAGILFASLFMLSCQKEKGAAPAVTNEEAQAITTENASAETEEDDLTEIGLSAGADLETVIEAGKAAPGTTLNGRLDLFADLRFRMGPCTKVTVSPDDISFPKTITIDYGEGCICLDGKFRKGKVALTFTAPIREPGASLTLTLSGYAVNRVQIEGTRIVTNLSTDNLRKYSVEVKGGRITWPNGRGFAWEGLKVKTQLEGSGTRTIRDDVYSLEGNSSIRYNNGVTVTKTITAPLIKPVACRWIVKGILQITINTHQFSIDFGTGECDNKVTLTGSTQSALVLTLP